ncbi:MAG TPA: hypothetical protein DDZ88_01810 [Verrucomicrobiales bacterium]|nr:hypothetical protein [Verrucomicrobiales bacterium]
MRTIILPSLLRAAGPAWLTTGEFHWRCSPPLITPAENAADPDVALKDPTMVFHDGKWHRFATHRRASGKVDMQHLNWHRGHAKPSPSQHPLKNLLPLHRSSS